jgi:hypothetical protein
VTQNERGVFAEAPIKKGEIVLKILEENMPSCYYVEQSIMTEEIKPIFEKWFP